MKEKTIALLRLVRLDKPVGILYLLWPTLICLLLVDPFVSNSVNWSVVLLGVIVTRSLGCAINDVLDREFDKQVPRTKSRPLADGSLTVQTAVVLVAILAAIAILLLLMLNLNAILVCVFAAGALTTYPLFKRFFAVPQLMLAICFSLPIPIVFLQYEQSLALLQPWLIFFANFCWVLAYDSIYALADRKADENLDINSSVRSWGNNSFRYICIFLIIAAVSFILAVYQLGTVAIAGTLIATLYGALLMYKLKGNLDKSTLTHNTFLKMHRVGAMCALVIALSRI